MESPRRSAIVYVHTSVAGEAAGGILRLQKTIARNWAEANGYTVARVMADIGRRSQLKDVLQAIQQKEFQALAISSIETLGGSAASVILLGLNQVGGVLLSAKERLAATGLFNR